MRRRPVAVLLLVGFVPLILAFSGPTAVSEPPQGGLPRFQAPRVPGTGDLALPQTGQTRCYDHLGAEKACAGTGHDGEYQASERWDSNTRFVRGTGAESECVLDTLTGFMWPVDAGRLGARVSWADALTHANTLTLCGHSDWRLPNINELQTIIHRGYNEEACRWSPCGTLAAWLESAGFSNVDDFYYWSSTTAPGSTIYAMSVSGTDGTVNVLHKVPTTNTGAVWAVRTSAQPGVVAVPATGQTACYELAGSGLIDCAGTGQDGELQTGLAWGAGRFVVGTGDEAACLTDTLTGLMWPISGNLSGTARSWANAIGDANASTLCGHDDWRLPNDHELGSLAHWGFNEEACGGGSCGDNADWLETQGFTLVLGSWYWTSTTDAADLRYARRVALGDNIHHRAAKSNATGQYVWAVRGRAEPCAFRTTPTWFFVDAAGSSGAAQVTTTAGCGWSADTATPWITITGGDEGTGSGTITFDIAANPGAGRLGVIQAPGRSVLIEQEGLYLPVTAEIDEGAGHGTVEPELQTVEFGTTAAILVTPDEHYRAEATSTCGGALVDTTFTTGPVTAACTVTVDFILTGKRLLVTTSGAGRGSATVDPGRLAWTADTGEAAYAEGTEVELTAAPASGSTFTGWSGGGCSGTDPCLVTMSDHRTVGAAFSRVVPSGRVQVPATGQRLCHSGDHMLIPCQGTGHDGDTRAGAAWPVPRFVAGSGAEAGCVTDTLTGVMWTQSPVTAATRTWAEAIDDINIGMWCGHDDWRLANLAEMQSLVHYGFAEEACGEAPCETPAAWLNTQGFTGVEPDWYWASTSWGGNPADDAWHVNLLDGRASTTSKPNPYYAWAVRAGQAGAPDAAYPANLPRTGQQISYRAGDDGAHLAGVSWPAPRFVESGETVTDTLSGLMWLKDANCMLTNHPEADPDFTADGRVAWWVALEFVRGVNGGVYGDCMAGFRDWRLANTAEMLSLADRSRGYPATLPTGHPFINVDTAYWTSTDVSGTPGQAWSFDTGTWQLKPPEDKGWDRAAWLVRTVPSSTPPVTYTLQLRKQGTTGDDLGSGTVTAEPGGVTWVGNLGGSADFAAGTIVTLSVAADAGSTFIGWAGEGCSGTGTCVVTMDADRNVTASIVLAAKTLTVTKTGAGSGGVTTDGGDLTWTGPVGTRAFPHGSSAILIAAADPGSVFTGWSGETCAGTGTCTLNMTKAMSVTAAFEATHVVTVATIGTGTGTVTGAGPYVHGQTATLVATASADSHFTGWGGDCGTATDLSIGVVVDADKACTARFSADDARILSLPRTGQTVCYDALGTVIACAGTGQDGESRRGAEWPSPRFVAGTGAGADCITDRLTGLMWAKAPAADWKSWDDAIDDANGRGLCGFDDWRLGTVVDVRTLFNEGFSAESCGGAPCATNSDWLMSQGFVGVGTMYWSSTTTATETAKAWQVGVDRGRVVTAYKHQNGLAWPVRAGQAGAPDPVYPSNAWNSGATEVFRTGDDADIGPGVSWPDPRFTDRGNATVKDNLTGLIWHQDGNCIATHYPSFDTDDVAGDGRVSWPHALEFVAGMNAGLYPLCAAGYSNWRLPDSVEGFSLHDYSYAGGLFMPGSPFEHVLEAAWTSTTPAAWPDTAWSFGLGRIERADKDEPEYFGFSGVWPVRNAQGASDMTYAIAVTTLGTGTGTITGEGIYHEGLTAELIAHPADDSAFEAWGGDCGTGSDPSIDVLMDGPKACTATFTLVTHAITPVVIPAAAGTMACEPNPVTHGSTSACTVTPAAGYGIQSVTGCGAGTLEGTVYTTGAVTDDCAVTATLATRPDFVVTAIVITPAVPVPGKPVTVKATLRNQGLAAGEAGTVSVWLDRAAPPACGEIGDGTKAVRRVNAGAQKQVVFRGLVAGPEGAKTLQVMADSQCVTAEANEANNAAAQAYTVVLPKPDFVVTGITFVPASPMADSLFKAKVTVRNQGDAAGDGGALGLWLDRLAAPACGDAADRTVNVGAVGKGARKVLTVTGLAAGAAGAKNLLAFVDSACLRPEKDESNNQFTQGYVVR